MAYRIFTGLRLENLVATHAPTFRAPFFGPGPWIVVQSQNLAQWLKLLLARETGGYATPELLFQDEALRRLLQRYLPEATPVLFLDNLKFALYGKLVEVLSDPDPMFDPLWGAGDPPDPARLFELADHIAGVFHGYAMNSELWPRALETGHLPAGSGADPKAFAWQARLWLDLVGGTGATLAGVVLDQLTLQPPAPSGPPPRLVIVGSAFLSRRATKFLTRWAEVGLVDIDHFLLLPCPPEVLRTQGRPWSSWGAFGRLFLEALPPLADDSELEFPTSALGALQNALASGRRFEGPGFDGSLEVVSAPHPLRELEVLRDQLLTILAQTPDLQIHEIALLAPDINVYAPFLDAVFRSDDPGRNLRYHVIDLDLGRENAWFRALDALLGLISGGFDRPALFTLVDSVPFQEAWGVGPEDRDLWLDYTEAVSAWREEAEPGIQTWSAGWDRLFGSWFRPEGAGAGPLEVTPSAFRSLGQLHELLSGLAQAARDTHRPRPFQEWIRFFEALTGRYLSADEGAGSELAGRLRNLVAEGDSPEVLWPWAGFRPFVQDQIAHFSGRRGQLLTEGLHCSSLRPLRAIPFRVIAILGLDEGRFPKSAATPHFDLRRHEPGQEALSSLAVDRYCFWETVMAARDLLYLSYQGFASDGSERPPSPVLADLLDFLEEGGTRWPVRVASVKDFSWRGGPGSVWSPRTHRRIAALTQEQASEVPRAVTQPLDEVFPEVTTSDIVQAFAAPARFHLGRVGLVNLREEDRRSIDDEEPWSLNFLERQAWLQEELRREWIGSGGSWDSEAWMDGLERMGVVRPGVFSDRDRRTLRRQAAQTAAWAQALKQEGWQLDPGLPPRLNWAGRPWASEERYRLVRGTSVLVPHLMYSETLPARTKVEAAVRFLVDPAPEASLALLSPRGTTDLLHWSLNDSQTDALARQAEAYWREAASRPFPFYPDYLEAVAALKEEAPHQGWSAWAEQAWRQVKTAQRVRSPGTLTNCPYAALAFPEEPDWPPVASELEGWWASLFQPLLEAWQ